MFWGKSIKGMRNSKKEKKKVFFFADGKEHVIYPEQQEAQDRKEPIGREFCSECNGKL